MLELDQIVVTIHGFTILRGVTLKLEPGSTAGLIGRNGAGKTTTLRSIIGLVPMDSGRLRLDGKSLVGLPPHARVAAGIGYAPEDRRLIGPLTARENILMPAWAMGAPDAKQRLSLIETLMPELKDLATRPAMQLSGGQQKLVALARGFMNARRIMLLDEPFEGVAAPLARRLARAIREFQEQQPGLAVLVAESEFKWVRLLASKTYVIERGMTNPEAS